MTSMMSKGWLWWWQWWCWKWWCQERITGAINTVPIPTIDDTICQDVNGYMSMMMMIMMMRMMVVVPKDCTACAAEVITGMMRNMVTGRYTKLHYTTQHTVQTKSLRLQSMHQTHSALPHVPTSLKMQLLCPERMWVADAGYLLINTAAPSMQWCIPMNCNGLLQCNRTAIHFYNESQCPITMHWCTAMHWYTTVHSTTLQFIVMTYVIISSFQPNYHSLYSDALHCSNAIASVFCTVAMYWFSVLHPKYTFIILHSCASSLYTALMQFHQIASINNAKM